VSIIHVNPSIPANSTNPNILSGSAFEFPTRHSKIDFGIVAAAEGCTARIQFGNQIIAESMAVPVATAGSVAGSIRGPVIPDELQIRDVALGGSRLVVAVTNTTAAAIVVRALVATTPLH